MAMWLLVSGPQIIWAAAEGPVADADATGTVSDGVDGCGADTAGDADDGFALDAAVGTAFVLAQPVNTNASNT
ncbi:MAG: hypothetical protein ACRDV3_11990 [Acidothermaceae bacterium]